MENKIYEINVELEAVNKQYDICLDKMIDLNDKTKELLNEYFKSWADYEFIKVLDYEIKPAISEKIYEKLEIEVSSIDTMEFTLYVYTDRLEFNVGSRGKSSTGSAFHYCIRALSNVLNHEKDILAFFNNIKDVRMAVKEFRDSLNKQERLEAELRNIARKMAENDALDSIKPGARFEAENFVIEISRVTPKKVYYYSLSKDLRMKSNFEYYYLKDNLVYNIISGNITKRGDE